MAQKVILSLMILLLCGGVASAQEAQVMSWEACLLEARANHPELVVAKARVDGVIAKKGSP